MSYNKHREKRKKVEREVRRTKMVADSRCGKQEDFLTRGKLVEEATVWEGGGGERCERPIVDGEWCCGVIDAEIVTVVGGGRMSVSGAINAAAVLEEEMQEAFGDNKTIKVPFVDGVLRGATEWQRLKRNLLVL